MAKSLNPPDLNYLMALRTEQETLYRDQDAQIDRSRQVREMQNVVPLPDSWKLVQIEVRDPTLTDETQRVAATLSINPPTLTVTPPKPTDAGQENATLREKWTEAIFEEAGTRIPGQHAFSSIVDACVGDGGGWSKFLFSRDLWDARYALRPGQFTDDPMTTDSDGTTRKVGRSAAQKFNEATEEAKKASGSPFVWQPCDVRGLYPLWRGVRLSEVLEVSRRPISPTFRQYRLTTDKQGNIVPDELGQPQNFRMPINGSSIYFFQHFDDVWATYAVVGLNLNGEETGQVVQQWRHGYERPPYFYAPGLQMNHWRNRKVGWGVSEAKRWLVEFRSFLWTLSAQAVARDTMASFTRTMADVAAGFTGIDGAPRKREIYEPGVIYDLLPGQTMQPLELPKVADSLKMLLTMVSESIEKLEDPHFGSQIGGLEGAGFAINQVLASTKIRHDPICQNIERALKEQTEFLWYLTRKKVRERIWVMPGGKESGWISAAPEDLTETVRVQWALNPEQPSDKLILNRYLTERLQNQTMGRDQAIEALGDNPDEVRLSIDIDDIRQSPQYKQLKFGQVLQEIGRGDLIGKALQAQQVASTGQIPPAMGGGNGLIPDLGALAASPNGAGAAPQQGPGPAAGMPNIPTQSGAAGVQEITQ